MKRIFLLAAAILMMTVSAQAQGLGGLLSKIGGSGNNNTTAGGIVSSITDLLSGKSALSAETIAGTWNYTGSAISFKSDDNPLSNIASNVAQGTLEKKLDGYLQKVGITQGLFGFTFNEDGNMKSYVAVKNGKMELLFDVTTLMKLVKSVTSVYNNSTLQTLNTMLNQYDKMYAGFNLAK